MQYKKVSKAIILEVHTWVIFMYRDLIIQLDKNSRHLGLYNYELDMIFEEISKSSLCFIEKRNLPFFGTLCR